MQLQFPKRNLSCLRRIRSEVRTVEETQELRMPEEMPDIARILGAWGQILIRSKQWRDDAMIINGGVMTWVLYQPENEEEKVQVAQCWIPFQLKWDLPETKIDGTICVVPRIQNIDARSTSARKIVARVSVSVLAQAYVPEQNEVPLINEVPEDICLLKQTYPMLLPKEAGEKIFELEEDLILPPSVPPVGKMLRFSVQPEIIDQKVLSGKVAFRGVLMLHMLYESSEGQLCTWNFEIPFAQYSQLDRDYEQQAQAQISPLLTSLELEELTDGKLRLKAGLSGQYMIYDEELLEVATDAYSPFREVVPLTETLEVPSVLDRQHHLIRTEQIINHSATRIVDAAFLPDLPSVRNSQDDICLGLQGIYQVLFTDEEMMLRYASARYEVLKQIPAGENVRTDVYTYPSGAVENSAAGGQIKLCGDICLDTTSVMEAPMSIISALEIGQMADPDPARPSLIVRKKESGSLWELAKQTHSTVEAIERANNLTGEPEDDDLLLIPVL